MPSNTSIVTTTAKDVTEQSVVDYTGGVLAHIEGDWIYHNVVRVLGGGTTSVPYTDQNGAVVGSDTCRLLVTETTGNTDIGVVMPMVAVELVSASGSSPVILVQPFDQSVAAGDTATFNVVAASAVYPITYQWFKDFSTISGATSTNLVLPGVVSTDAGTYTVTVYNTFGSVASNIAELTVT